MSIEQIKSPENPKQSINNWEIFQNKQNIDWVTINQEKLGSIEWSVLDTEKFRTYFQTKSKPFVKDCAEQVDNVFTFLEKYFPNHNIKEKISIIASSDPDMHKKTQKELGLENITGVPRIDNLNQPSKILLNAKNWNRNTLHILMHETTHIFYYNSGYRSNHKNWSFVGEHLAWYFQEKLEERGKYALDEKAVQQGMMKQLMFKYLKEHPKFSLEELKQGIPDPPDCENEDEGRGRGEIIVTLYNFLEEQYGQEKFSQFLNLLLEHEDINVEQACKQTYGKGLQELNKEWKNYYKLDELI